MRAVAALTLALFATGCPRTLSEPDRAALQDFRAVERTALARAAELVHAESIRLMPYDELAKAVQSDLVVPWQAMRARTNLAERALGDELAAALRRYLDEREIAWQALGKAWSEGRYRSDTNHGWEYRDSTEAADKDKAIIDARLAALKLPPLPPLPPPTVVDVAPPPPPGAPPGPAFFLVDRAVVRLDDHGFSVVARDVDAMDVLPDGTLWACSETRVVRWDGARTSEYAAKLRISDCTAAPDGTLWALDDRSGDGPEGVDLLGHFDGKAWKITKATIGDPNDHLATLLCAPDGHLYAATVSAYESKSGGLYMLDKARWRRLELRAMAGQSYENRLLRAADGAVWISYRLDEATAWITALARVTPEGGEAPAHRIPEVASPGALKVIDAAGALVTLDPSRNVVASGGKEKRLHLPVVRDIMGGGHRGPFAIDGAGRIWITLADGLNVIAPGDARTVYPRGSIADIVTDITDIVVVGAGPATLVPPGPVVTRTITGTLRGAGKLELSLCGDPWLSCPDGLPAWKTYSDAEGAFTFEKVPRWRFRMRGLVGLSGQKSWSDIDSTCCADAADLGEVAFAPGPIY